MELSIQTAIVEEQWDTAEFIDVPEESEDLVRIDTACMLFVCETVVILE